MATIRLLFRWINNIVLKKSCKPLMRSSATLWSSSTAVGTQKLLPRVFTQTLAVGIDSQSAVNEFIKSY